MYCLYELHSASTYLFILRRPILFSTIQRQQQKQQLYRKMTVRFTILAQLCCCQRAEIGDLTDFFNQRYRDYCRPPPQLREAIAKYLVPISVPDIGSTAAGEQQCNAGKPNQNQQIGGSRSEADDFRQDKKHDASIIDFR
jgi:hypothetical protein